MDIFGANTGDYRLVTCACVNFNDCFYAFIFTLDVFIDRLSGSIHLTATVSARGFFRRLHFTTFLYRDILSLNRDI